LNLWAQEPQLEKEFPKQRSLWTDPIIGLTVPKNPSKNLQWRAKLLREAEVDLPLRDVLYTACAKSLLFFVNFAAWTLRVFQVKNGQTIQAEDTHIPYVTWPIQDDHLLAIERAINVGESLLTDKSRDMGATWDHLVVLAHRLLFKSSEAHLIISRKEDAVDLLDGPAKDYPFGSQSDPGTLFGKVDYILAHLPEWMIPNFSRKKMHLRNGDNGSRIDGESSNATAGSSDRRKSVFLDEFAKVDEAESIKRSIKDVSACILPCSTPNGPGTVFSKWRMSGSIKVFVLPWWEHPEKGADRTTWQDALGRWKIISPWYTQQILERSPKELAIEVDMDHVGSGETFFENIIIEQHKKLFARVPKYRASIKFKKGMTDEDVVRAGIQRQTDKVICRTIDGPWRIWTELIDKRPDQTKTYTLAIDISKGQGASNSVISILCNETREKIAEYADANTPPYELAKSVVAATIWCGGTRRPFVIWENNGDPGFDFGRQLVNVYKYPDIYFDKQVGTTREKVGKRYGWRSSSEKKAIALGILRRAYANGTFINHSEAALNECLMYVYYPGGGVGPADLIKESDSARKTHGDRVIADALLLVGAPKCRAKVIEQKGDSMRTFGGRFNKWQQVKRFRERRDGKYPTHFDFRMVD